MSDDCRFRFVVPDGAAGDRLDRCLAALQDRWSRSRIRRLIDDGLVELDGTREISASDRVRAGSSIEVEEPPAADPVPRPEALALAVIHEDDDLLVVDKPAGMTVHPAAGNPDGTLVNALLHHTDRLSRIGGGERPGIVHRLDKDTTGVMVVAKTDGAHHALTVAFRHRRVHKTYLAVCYGEPADRELVVDAPIGRHPRERQRMAVVSGGRPARTVVEVRERLDGVAVVAASPVTGRTHQIRVHLAHAGHALVGDPLYAGRQWRTLRDPAAGRACRDFPRQALHAWRLAFRHPGTGDEVSFEAPLPADLAGLLDDLRENRPGAAADERPG